MKASSNRLEPIRRKRFGGQARPKAVAIAGHDRKSSDAGSLHGVVNLRALGIGTRPIPVRRQAYPDAGHGFVKVPGKFCRSARISKVPIEFPQIFQVALEARSFWMNHSFCFAPRMVCGGELRLKFATSFWPKRIDSGALLLL